MNANQMYSYISGLKCRHQKKKSEFLKFYQAPKFLTSNPFILSGYRRKMSVRECLMSIFQIHNETANIWTHLIGVFFFCSYLLDNYYKYESTPQKTMFYVSVGACITCYLLSCVYHTFNCHSHKLYQTLLYCDFIGIVATICGITGATIFFIMRCSPEARNIYMICCFGFGILLVSSIIWQIYFRKSCFGQISQYLFLLFIVFGTVPLVHWIISQGWDSPEVKASFTKIMLAYIFLALGFVCWKFHIPERWLIGKCDIWFSSHQLWHIMVMLGPAYFLFAGEEALLYAKTNPCF